MLYKHNRDYSTLKLFLSTNYLSFFLSFFFFPPQINSSTSQIHFRIYLCRNTFVDFMCQEVLKSLQSSECHNVHLTVPSLIQAGFDWSHPSVCITRYRCPFFILSGNEVSSFLNFNTTPMTADPLSVGESENLGSRNEFNTLQRSIVPSLDSFGKLNFDFLALLNLLQLSG